MAYYFVANIKIHDNDTYQKYIEKTEEVFRKYNGQYLAVDNSPVVLEGKWEYTRNVIITFPSREEFNQWYYSSEYQNILKYRLEGALCDTILVTGS